MILFLKHSMSLRRNLFLLIAFTLLVLPAYTVYAEESAGLTVTPVIIDQKTKVRDILKESITITNTTERKLSLYPSVYDVDPSEGEEEFVRAEGREERSHSLANWIELSRGVIELSPGEEKIIPMVIRVHMDAEPGTYHSRISFSEGSTRDEAEQAAPLQVVAVNLEVEADIKEVLELAKFFTDNIYLSGDDVLFNLQIENIGNRDLKPKGEIRIYDRKGAEVASIPVNGEGTVFSPEEKAQLASVWSAADGFGKYKAFLNVDYGSTQTASVQDTVYFWIVPWKEIALSFTIGIMIVIFLVFYFHRESERKYALAHSSFVPVPSVHREPTTHKKPFFNWPFGRKRHGSMGSASAQQLVNEERNMHVEAEAHREPHQTILTVEPEHSRVASHGHTINLKDVPRMRQEATHEGHVINLKK